MRTATRLAGKRTRTLHRPRTIRSEPWLRQVVRDLEELLRRCAQLTRQPGCLECVPLLPRRPDVGDAEPTGDLGRPMEQALWIQVGPAFCDARVSEELLVLLN